MLTPTLLFHELDRGFFVRAKRKRGNNRIVLGGLILNLATDPSF
jgi:hypothetical protein